MQPTSLRSQTRSSMTLFAAESLALPTGILTAAYLTRTLGPVDYGLYGLAGGVIAWLQSSVIAVFSRASIRHISAAKDPVRAAPGVLRFYLALGLLTSIMVLVLAGPLARLMQTPDLARLLMLYAADVLLFTTSNGLRSALVGLGYLGKRATASAARWIARLIFVVAFVALGWGVEGAILGSICATLCQFLITLLGSGLEFRGGDRLDVGPFLRSAASVLLVAIPFRLYERLDLLLLRPAGVSEAGVGLYAAAQTMVTLGSIVSVSVAPLLLATASRGFAVGDREAVRVAARGALNLVLIFVILSGPIAGLSNELGVLFFGARFAAAGSLLPPMLVKGIVMATVSMLSSTLVAAREDARAAGMSVGLCVLSAVGLVFCARYSLDAVAMWTAFAGVVAAGYGMWMVRRLLGSATGVANVAIACGGFIGLTVLGQWLHNLGMPPIANAALLSAAALALLWCTPDLRNTLIEALRPEPAPATTVVTDDAAAAP